MEPVIRKKVVTAAAILGGLLLVAVILAAIVSRNHRGSEGGGVASPAVEVDALDLHAEYARNAIAADDKYRTQRIRVRGQVLGVERVSGGYAVGLFATPKIVIGGGYDPPGTGRDRLQAAIARAEAERDNPKDIEPGVVAVFSSRPDVAKLRNHDSITVEGTCAGRMDSRGRIRGAWIVIDYATVVPQPVKSPDADRPPPARGKTRSKKPGPDEG